MAARTRGERGLRATKLALLRVHRVGLRHPRAVVLATLGFVLIAAPAALKIPVHLAIRELSDPDARATAEMRRMEASFGHANSFSLLLRPTPGAEGFSSAQSRRIQAWMAACEQDPRVLELRSALQIAQLPDLTHPSLEQLRTTPWHGVLTDLGCRDVLIEVSLADSPVPTRYGRYDPDVVEEIVADAKAQLGDRDQPIDVLLSGAGAFELYSLQGIRRFRLLNVGVVLLLILLSRLSLGSWRAGLLLLLPVFVASAVVYGGMAWTGHPIDLLSTGLFLLLALAAIEDFFFLSHLAAEQRAHWRIPFRRLLLASAATSLTTVLGFGSMMASDLDIVRRLGLWAAIGAGVEWLATFLVLPALLSLWSWPRHWCRPERVWRRGKLQQLAFVRWPRPIAYVLLLVLPAAAFGALHLNYADSPEWTFDRRHPHRSGLEALRESRGWVGSFWVVAPRSDADGAENYEREWLALDEVLRLLRLQERVVAIVDPLKALGDASSQRAALVPRVPHLEIGEFEHQGLAASDGALRAQVFVSSMDLDSIGFLRDLVRSVGAEAGVYPAGELIGYADFAESVPRTLLRSLVVCLFLVGGLVALVIGARRRRSVAPALLAAAWGPGLMLMLLAVLAIPVNFLTCVFACVLVGLTGDNALQYACAEDARGRPVSLVEGSARRGGASIRIALLTACCALVFLGSSFVASRRLGLLLACGMLASLIGDLWILRSLLPRKEAT